MTFSKPQYGHFSEFAPGANSRFAPHWLHGYCFSTDCGVAPVSIDQSQAFGGIGGGTFANTDAKAETSPAAVHCPMPCVHTRFSRVSRPIAACDARVCRSNGPVCWPFTATKYVAAPGIGGGVPAAVAACCPANACPIGVAIAIPRPMPAPAAPRPPGFFAASGMELATLNCV